MLKSYKYRLYPNAVQTELLNKHFGSVRFVYNLSLETKIMAYSGSRVSLSGFELCRQLTDLKKELKWLKEINSQSLQQSIINMETAFLKFFKGESSFPNFKKKHSIQSFSVPQKIYLDFEKNLLRIPKFKNGIKVILHRRFDGVIKQGTLSKSKSGKFFVSVLVDTLDFEPAKKPIAEHSAIGIDMGINSFITTSNGEKIDSPRFLKKSIKKLKFIHRRLRKFNGKRTKLKFTLLHEKIANQRKDFIQKNSTLIIKNHDTICVENLNILGMKQNKKISQAISDSGWGSFIDCLLYKSKWNGNNLIKIGRFEPSSKLCNNCGSINNELKLATRSWVCKKCNANLDRDVNAAINIKKFALRNLSKEFRLKNQNELPTLVGVLTSEA